MEGAPAWANGTVSVEGPQVLIGEGPEHHPGGRRYGNCTVQLLRHVYFLEACMVSTAVGLLVSLVGTFLCGAVWGRAQGDVAKTLGSVLEQCSSHSRWLAPV